MPVCNQSHMFDTCEAFYCGFTSIDGETVAGTDAAVAARTVGHWAHESCGYCSSRVCEEHCRCRDCADCGAARPESKCERCDNCEDCCECSHCENRYHERQSGTGYSVVESTCTRCDNCTDCCECSHCDRCGPVESTCERCDRCDSGYNQCCECFRCQNCSEAAEYGCSDCQRCTDCECQCETDDDNDDDSHRPGRHAGTPVRFRSNDAPHFHNSPKAKLVGNRSRRFAALEIEVSSAESGSELNRVADQWDAQIVKDGSLPSGGFEINTAPANGDVLLDQLADWADALSAQSASANKDCGLHVHIDCRDFTFYDMRRMVLLYERLEPALFGMVPQSRRGASWCVPSGHKYANAVRQSAMPKQSKANLIDGIYNSGTSPRSLKAAVSNAKSNKYASERYHALNIHSWLFRGTIECRLHTGTVNGEKLANWALLWVAIVDHAYATTEKAIAADTRSSLELLQSIAPTADIAEWIGTRTAKFAGGY